MSRFFKSAAFPILIVVIIAFFAAKLIVPSSQKGPTHSYQSLVTTDIPKRLVKSATLKVKDNSVAVTLYSNKGEKYEVGFVDQQVPKLEEELRKYGVAFNVESNKTSIWPSLLTYLLPLVLILGFWFFLII
ncbi:MAG: ATP-dependent metallopeptidase FtsH/Yme1/Tma family protein [Solirubrobacteraceae bacterium]